MRLLRSFLLLALLIAFSVNLAWAQQPTETKPPFALNLLATQAARSFVCNPTGGTTTPQACSLASYFNWAGSTLGINTMVGDSGTGGQAGLAPAPAAGDAAGRFLKADGTYAVPPGGGGGATISGMSSGQLAKAQNATAINSSQAFNVTPTANNIPLADGSGHLNNGWFAAIPNTSLANSSVTVAGHSMALGASTALSVGDLAAINNNTFIGNISGVTAAPAALTATQATAALNPCNATTKGLAPTPPNNTNQVLRGDCTFAAMPGGPTATNVWTAQNSAPPCPLGFANPLASSATSCTAGSNYGVTFKTVTLTGNTTLQRPTGLVDGQPIVFDFLEDATGGHTVSLPTDGTIWAPSSVLTGATIKLTTLANASNRIACNGAGGSSPSFASTRLVCTGSAFGLEASKNTFDAARNSNGGNYWSLSNNNLTATRTAATGSPVDVNAFTTVFRSSGKWYFRFTPQVCADCVNGSSIGMATSGETTNSYLGHAGSLSFAPYGGALYINNLAITGSVPAWAQGQPVDTVVDLTNKTVQFSVSGGALSGAISIATMASMTLSPAVTSENQNDVWIYDGAPPCTVCTAANASPWN